MPENKSDIAASYYKTINRQNVQYYKLFLGTLNFILNMKISGNHDKDKAAL